MSYLMLRVGTRLGCTGIGTMNSKVWLTWHHTCTAFIRIKACFVTVEHALLLPAGNYGVLLHPHLATATTLCSHGAPTMVLEHVSPQTADMDVTGDVKNAWLFHPNAGSHICFDGR